MDVFGDFVEMILSETFMDFNERLPRIVIEIILLS